MLGVFDWYTWFHTGVRPVAQPAGLRIKRFL